MRTSLLILLIAILVGCMSTTKHFGQVFEPKAPVTVDSLITALHDKGSLKDVQVEGKVEKSCMSEGCWFTILDANGKEVLFNIKDKRFRVPVNSPGQSVVVLADASLDTSAEHNPELSVKGMRFK